MGTFIRIVSSLLIAAFFASCTQTLPVSVTNIPVLTLQTERPWQNGSTRATIRLHLDRNGVSGDVRFHVVGLPDSVYAEETVIPSGQSETILTLEAKDFCFDDSTTVNVEGETDGTGVSSRLPLRGLRLASETQSGRANVDVLSAGEANVNLTSLASKSVYANFKGSLCQVMINGLDRFLYVCFNGPLKVGQTYSLGLERGTDKTGTASVTYVESSICHSPKPRTFWDSASGQIEVTEASATVLRFQIRQARMVPAQGFKFNQAAGAFTLQGDVEVTDIENFPG